jgi:hypothetical protein
VYRLIKSERAQAPAGEPAGPGAGASVSAPR